MRTKSVPIRIGTHSILLLAALASHAAMVTQYQPDDSSNTGWIKLYEQYTNNDTNTIYNSATVRTYSNLLDRIWHLTNNQTAYSSLSNMIVDKVQFVIEPSALYVDRGWIHTLSADGSFTLSHDVRNYDAWDQSIANQRTMDTTLDVDKSLLTPTGDAANWGAPGSFRIVLTTNVVANAFVPTDSQGYTSPTTALAYALEEITAAGITGVTAEPNVQVAVETRTTLNPTNPVTLEATDASFTNWTPIATATPTNATALLTDTNPPTSFRLYRVRQ